MSNQNLRPDFIWATMSWPEISERLKIVDTAILSSTDCICRLMWIITMRITWL